MLAVKTDNVTTMVMNEWERWNGGVFNFVLYHGRLIWRKQYTTNVTLIMFVPQGHRCKVWQQQQYLPRVLLHSSTTNLLSNWEYYVYTQTVLYLVPKNYPTWTFWENVSSMIWCQQGLPSPVKCLPLHSCHSVNNIKYF